MAVSTPRRFAPRAIVDRLLERFRPPRRLIPTRAGYFTLVAPIFLGVAAINATNNLLFVLLGVSLGLIVLSGLLSEQNLRGLRVDLRPTGAVHAQDAARIAVRLEREGKGPAFGVELRERVPRGQKERLRVSLPVVETKTVVLAERVFPRRGRVRLERFELCTRYPFGLFRKERDLETELLVLVRPRRIEVPEALASPLGLAAEGRAAGQRGQGLDIYGLREREERDPLHRVHALRSLSIGRDVVVETETLARPVAWLGIWNEMGAEPEAFERTLEIAAATLLEWEEHGYAVGLCTAAEIFPPGECGLDDLLDCLAELALVAASLDADASPLWLCPAGVGPGSDLRAQCITVDAAGRLEWSSREAAA